MAAQPSPAQQEPPETPDNLAVALIKAALAKRGDYTSQQLDEMFKDVGDFGCSSCQYGCQYAIIF